MKLLKLEILNLASLDRLDGEVINFEEGALKDSTIFSIVGSTGSGKSTILDAICLALYNRAPRYPRQKGDRNQKFEIYGDADDKEKNRLAPSDCRNILTRGRKSGYSKLTFLANNGIVYRAEWSVRFMQKNYQDAVVALYSITDVNGVAVEKEEDWSSLPMIIGLDYEQFLRTVLIAQGTFSDFLNAKEDERFLLLEKLIGNGELYTKITDDVKTMQKNADKAYTEIAASVASYKSHLIEESELQLVEARIKELEKEETADNEEKKLIAEALAWYKKEHDMVMNISQYEKEYSRIQSELEANKDAAEKLQLHDATLPAVGLYRIIQDAKADICNIDAGLKILDGQFENAKSDLEKKLTGLEALKETEVKANDEYQEQKPHIAKARELKGELAALESSEQGLQEGVTKAQEASAAALKAVQGNEKNIAALKEDVGQKQAALDRLGIAIKEKTSELTAALESSNEKFEQENKKIEDLDPEKLHNAKSAADKVLADVKEASRITVALKENRLQSVAKLKEQKELQDRNDEIDKELASLTIASLSNELNVMKKAHTLMTSENWDMHRKDLSDGGACPLCGSTEHPYAKDENFAPVISELDNLIKAKETELQKQESSKNRLDKEKSINEGKIEASKETLTNLDKAIKGLEDEWAQLKNQYAGWQQDADSLETELVSAQECCNKAKSALDEYNRQSRIVVDARTEMDRAKFNLDKYKESSADELKSAQKAVIDAEMSYQAECAKKGPLSEQLKAMREAQLKAERDLEQGKVLVSALQDALKAEIGDRDLDRFEAELEKNLKEATAGVEKMTAAIGKVREGIMEIEGKKQVATENRNAAEKKVETTTTELGAWLNRYNAQEDVEQLQVEDIAALNSSTENWEDIRSVQKQLDAEHTRRQTTLENEKSAHKIHQQNKPEKTEEELSTRQAELEAKNGEELKDARDRMRIHNNAKTQMGILYNDEVQAAQAKADWDQIAAAIGSDGKIWRKIAQCYTLSFLIEHANAEIRKFNSRYELMQVKNSLGIRVIDHDRADDVRDTTSLSGGETFIVSLGLALGLSALSSKNISFENLFIDEGFGTLDPDTLGVVIDSLAMLQSSQGKKVGVISHTDTMSDRITTQIRIVKNGDSGSSRIEMWPS